MPGCSIYKPYSRGSSLYNHFISIVPEADLNLPLLKWSPDDPTNRRYWDAQHGQLKWLDPPYVYNVFKGDKEGFVKAVKSAIENPIGRFVC